MPGPGYDPFAIFSRFHHSFSASKSRPSMGTTDACLTSVSYVVAPPQFGVVSQLLPPAPQESSQGFGPAEAAAARFHWSGGSSSLSSTSSGSRKDGALYAGGGEFTGGENTVVLDPTFLGRDGRGGGPAGCFSP